MSGAQATEPATTVHVEPDPTGRWSVRRDSESLPLSRHTSATMAELAARALDRRVVVVVHDRYGRIHTRRP